MAAAGAVLMGLASAASAATVPRSHHAVAGHVNVAAAISMHIEQMMHAGPPTGAEQALLPQGAVPAQPPPASARPLPGMPSAGRDTVSCYLNENIRSLKNNLWVSTEVGYPEGFTGMLRARTGDNGSATKYAFCFDSTRGYWYIVSQASNTAVSNELGYPGWDYEMLRARASIIGPWEQFSLYCISGKLAIKSNVGNDWVTNNDGYPGGEAGLLTANSPLVGEAQAFSTSPVHLGC